MSEIKNEAVPAIDRRYPVSLHSRGGRIVYATTLANQRTLENTEKIIAKADEKIAEADREEELKRIQVEAPLTWFRRLFNRK